MGEMKLEVKTFRIIYQCEDCTVGVLKPTGVAFMTSPPKYEHQCTNCEKKQFFSKKYPRIIHEEIKK